MVNGKTAMDRWIYCTLIDVQSQEPGFTLQVFIDRKEDLIKPINTFNCLHTTHQNCFTCSFLMTHDPTTCKWQDRVVLLLSHNLEEWNEYTLMHTYIQWMRRMRQCPTWILRHYKIAPVKRYNPIHNALSLCIVSKTEVYFDMIDVVECGL